MKKIRLSKPVKLVLELVALGLLVFLFIKVLDFKNLREYIRLITPRVILGILGFQAAILGLQTLQWSLILREAGIFRGIWKTFWSRISGFSLTYLTPSLYFGGEPVRASLYKDPRMSYQRLYATIALDKYIELATKFPCIITGFALLVFLAHPSTALVVVSGSFIAACIGFFGFVITRLFNGKVFIVRLFKRVLRPLARINRRAAVRVLRAMREFAEDVERLIRRRKIFYFAMLAGIVVAVVEVFQTCYILAVLGQTSLTHSFVIFATMVIQGLIGLLPGNLGGMEGTHLFIFNVLGLGSNQSLVYTIILRIGQMTMVLLGILNIFFWRIMKVRASARGADRIRTDA
jgi:uncharacterized protein (TIRG00374 family)